ncbi:MAG: hypothetical protein IJP07_04545 [Firmicutes bacterium]|nr:hypothetical protein [Bacillota bacterium]
MRNLFAFRHPEWTLRRKLFGYMLLLAALLLLALVSGLFLFGRFDSVGKNIYESLDVQMDNFEKDISTHLEGLAAASIQLSLDTTALLESYLAEQGISFPELNDSQPQITAVQDRMLESLRQKLLQENCSAAFVMLDVTVNSSLEDAAFSRSGLYLQQSGYNSLNKSTLLYRGPAEIGKQHGLVPHRKWRLEFRTDMFPSYSQILSGAMPPLEEAYLLTDRFTLPGTSEDAVLMAAPVLGRDGSFYGVCGYEISSSFFKTYHGQPTKIRRLSCLLTRSDEAVLDASAGLSCGVSQGYYLEPKGTLSIGKVGEGLRSFAGDGASYIGVSREIQLTPNNAPYTMAVMMPREDYDRVIMKTLMQNVLLWALILFFAVSCCMFFSRHYLAPILKGLDQIKSANRAQAQSSIPEINDLFVFLAEQDRIHEDSLTVLEQEKQTVQNEKERLAREYGHARLVYEKAQKDYLKAQDDLLEAKRELDRLAYSRKTEIDPDDYQYFLTGLQTLTKRERDVFNWYLEGKTAEEILELAGIKEGTLKCHNHNILNKLGVSSRKQMLRYAALMKQQEDAGGAS